MYQILKAQKVETHPDTSENEKKLLQASKPAHCGDLHQNRKAYTIGLQLWMIVLSK